MHGPVIPIKPESEMLPSEAKSTFQPQTHDQSLKAFPQSSRLTEVAATVKGSGWINHQLNIDSFNLYWIKNFKIFIISVILLNKCLNQQRIMKTVIVQYCKREGLRETNTSNETKTFAFETQDSRSKPTKDHNE